MKKLKIYSLKFFKISLTPFLQNTDLVVEIADRWEKLLNSEQQLPILWIHLTRFDKIPSAFQLSLRKPRHRTQRKQVSKMLKPVFLIKLYYCVSCIKLKLGCISNQRNYNSNILDTVITSHCCHRNHTLTLSQISQFRYNKAIVMTVH